MNTFIGEFLVIESEGSSLAGIWAIVYSIKSNMQYVVTYSRDHRIKGPEGSKAELDYGCTCPSYRFHPGHCKHIKHVFSHSKLMPHFES
jgi:hypothetical protein